MGHSAGDRLRKALTLEKPLQVAGTINAYSAIMAERVGFRALYLSGAGVANAAFGLPDLGITTLQDSLEEVRRITSATEQPLLVDVDTGFGGAFQIARTIKLMTRAGAAGVHIEDQIADKRCGHRPNKAIVRQEEMVDRIRAAADAKEDSQFVIMARTDALAVEGLNAAIERACACVEAGADMIFPEAVARLEDYRAFADAVKVPILANITEFGQTPLYTTEELRSAGVSLALYPLSAFRAMSAAALQVYQTIRREGTQKTVLEQMQTRAELYDFLDYFSYEEKLDQLYSSREEDKSDGD
ncbi:methylisocitrate lyase [Paenibacillus sp. FSL H8-0548]|nr:methylisocitrate lyase [Paenibacillus sp. FSL H8-0548]